MAVARVIAFQNELKDNPIFRRQRTREIFASGEDLGLPKSPHDSPSASSATSASVYTAQRSAAVLMGSEIRKVVRNRDGRSEGSLLSMGSSEHDEDSGFGQTSRHSSKLSLAEKKSQDGFDWDLGEPPLGAAPLSHSAARHKMAVRPRRTMAGPTRHRRLQQLSASVLPSMPEMNEDAVSGGITMSITKSQSETMHYRASAEEGTAVVTVSNSSTSTTTKVSSTSATTSITNYARREKMTRASARPTTPSPTHSPSTKLSRSKSTGADRKIRHEVERYENKREVDPKTTPLRHLSPLRRSSDENDRHLQTSSTSVNSGLAAGRESRRRDLRRIKKDKEEKKNAANTGLPSKSTSAEEPMDATSAANTGAAGNTFFSRLFGSRRSYKKKKDEGKRSDGHAVTDDDDEDGGFSAQSKDALKKTPAAASVSPVRRMDPKGGYAQDTDGRFLSPDAYARDAEASESPPAILAGKNPLFKFPLRSNRSNMLPSGNQGEDTSGTRVEKRKPSFDKGEDSVLIQPDVIRKTAMDSQKDPPRPNFLLGSAVTTSQPHANQGLIPPKPARSSLPFGRPSLHHQGNQQPGHSPKPPRIEGLSRFQKKVLLVDDEGDEENHDAHRNGRSKSAATTPDDDDERVPNVLRQARSFRQTNSASNSEYNLKRLSQQPQSSSQELLKDELEAKWQLRKSNASFERLDAKESASPGVQMREKRAGAPTDENTEHRRKSLFGEILRPTGFFDRSQSPVNNVNNVETGPMSLDSVLTTRTEDSGGSGLPGLGDDYSSSGGAGSSLNSTGPVSLMVIPPSRPSVVGNKRPLVAIRSSGVPVGGRKPNDVDDDNLYDDEDDDGVREPPLKPKLWDCKIRKFERNAPASSSGSSTSSSASSSSTSTSSCSVGQTPPPPATLMETDLDDDVVETNPIVASFARPSFISSGGTATTRPRNVVSAAPAMSTPSTPAEPESPAPKTVIKIGELRRTSASKIPILATSVPASASLVAAVGKASSASTPPEEDAPVKMRNKPKPIPISPTAVSSNNGEGVFSRASLRTSASANAGGVASEQQPTTTAANELLKVFQRRSLKAKDAETLQAQVVEMLEKDKPSESVAPPMDEPSTPPALSAKPVVPPVVEKPKLTASKSLGTALSSPSHGTNNNNSNGVANANLNASKPSTPAAVQGEGIPEWKKIAQQRKEKREQLEQLSVKGDADGDNPARNAAARSSKVLDLVNNFQKRTSDPPAAAAATATTNV